MKSSQPFVEYQAIEPQDVSRVRRAFERQLAEWGCADVADAALVFSELVTNAVAHAGGATRICANRLGRFVRLEVYDHAPAGLARRRARGEAGGHGISIVEQLCSGWGWRRTGRGKVVWANLPVDVRGVSRRRSVPTN